VNQATETTGALAMKQTDKPRQRSQSKTPREVNFFTAVVMMNDFIDNEMPNLKPAELRLALTIWRKTIGWGKLSDQIGTKQFCKVANLNRDTVKDSIHTACEKVGIVTEQKRENGVVSRRRYTWPKNDRVKATLDEVSQRQNGGGQNTPQSEGDNPPTQLHSNKLKSIPFGNLSLYSDKV
jgi:Bacteriophage replication protein O